MTVKSGGALDFRRSFYESRGYGAVRQLIKRLRGGAAIALVVSMSALPVSFAAAQGSFDWKLAVGDVHASLLSVHKVFVSLRARAGQDSDLSDRDIEHEKFMANLARAFFDLRGTKYGETSVLEVAMIQEDLLATAEAIVQENKKQLLGGEAGGFVPAKARAQLFRELTERTNGRFKGLATTRRSELVNSDSRIDAVFKEPEVAAFLTDLVEKGDPNPMAMQFGENVVSYFPMQLSEGCAACHSKHGVAQKSGEYGGALVFQFSLPEIQGRQ